MAEKRCESYIAFRIKVSGFVVYGSGFRAQGLGAGV
jgi:hypothetical protein